MTKCPIQEENEKLKKANKECKKEIEILQSKIGELLQNFGKDKKNGKDDYKR